MAYVKKELVQKCLDDLSHENLIGNDNDTYISLAEAKDKIEELPDADVVEVKHGRYIADTNYRTLGNCSECGGDLTCLNNYCPNCGAKMDGKPQKGV